MNIGIAGTNRFNNYNLFVKIVTQIIKKTYSQDISIIILDNLKKENDFLGVPLMAQKFSNKHLYNSELITIDFNDFSHKLSKKREKDGRVYNANAGLIQNKEFIKKCDFFIIFHRNEKNFQYLTKMAKDQNIIFFNFDLSKKQEKSYSS